MRPRVRLALLLLLTGCRGAIDTADPADGQRPPVDPASDAAPVKPAPSPEPEPPTASSPSAPAALVPPPEPEPEWEPADWRARVQGLRVEVRIDEQPPAREEASPTYALVVSIDGATQGDRLISLPATFDFCERSSAVVEPVEGEPSPLVLAEAFCEGGEDELSRDILSAVVHVGDAATPPRVLWQGKGSFSSSFGICQRIDVPLAEVPRAGMLLIEQLTEVVFDPSPDLPEIRCRAKKARVRKKAEISF